MKKAYETPELEICRFDLEEHLATTCGGQDDDVDDHGGHRGGGGHHGGGGGGHGRSILNGLFGVSLLDSRCAPNGSV